jgi:purine-nucleoside phosphorylase
MGVPFRTGKTWTTDAIYRETPDLIELRRSEGCITVEMEAAAFFAVSQYYDLPLAQLLYTGDDVSGEAWDPRDWNTQKQIRDHLISCAAELAAKL